MLFYIVLGIMVLCAPFIMAAGAGVIAGTVDGIGGYFVAAGACLLLALICVI